MIRISEFLRSKVFCDRNFWQKLRDLLVFLIEKIISVKLQIIKKRLNPIKTSKLSHSYHKKDLNSVT